MKDKKKKRGKKKRHRASMNVNDKQKKKERDIHTYAFTRRKTIKNKKVQKTPQKSLKYCQKKKKAHTQ